MSESPKKIAVIIGSTRPNRIGDKVAALVKSVLEESTEKTLPTPPVLSIVDIKDFNLPLFDEGILPAMVPAYGEFAHEHSKVWNAEIAKYDAYVFVTAEWNQNIPGSAKNAIDYLYHSWLGKPIMIVSYGIFGGSTAGDILRKMFAVMHLQVVDTKIALTFPDADAANHNSSPGLTGALSGQLIEPVAALWKKESKDDFLKAYSELQTKLA